jgi:hypothetical protein
VEQGQALATVGNSGYTLGEGGGYHVHVSVTRALAISASSIPFQFEEVPETRRVSWNRAVVSSNASPLCDCRERHPGEIAHAPAGPQVSAQVSVAQWWSELVSVPKGARTFDVSVAWRAASAQLDLHLVSPSGRHYAWYAETTGYSGANTNPQEFHLPRPEPGAWRISVEGVRGGSEPIEFTVQSSPAAADTHIAASHPISRQSQQAR